MPNCVCGEIGIGREAERCKGMERARDTEAGGMRVLMGVVCIGGTLRCTGYTGTVSGYAFSSTARRHAFNACSAAAAAAVCSHHEGRRCCTGLLVLVLVLLQLLLNPEKHWQVVVVYAQPATHTYTQRRRTGWQGQGRV